MNFTVPGLGSASPNESAAGNIVGTGNFGKLTLAADRAFFNSRSSSSFDVERTLTNPNVPRIQAADNLRSEEKRALNRSVICIRKLARPKKIADGEKWPDKERQVLSGKVLLV